MPTTKDQRSTDDVEFRVPTLDDGADVWRAMKASGALDENSPYIYVLWCDYFADASVVAVSGGELVGFVCGFRPPRKPDTLFVWQVAVDDSQRGKGIAGRMISEILRRESGLHYVEATVTPTNVPSMSLFRGVAKRLDVPCEESDFIRADHFPTDDHEPERLFRIGPFEEQTQ